MAFLKFKLKLFLFTLLAAVALSNSLTTRQSPYKNKTMNEYRQVAANAVGMQDAFKDRYDMGVSIINPDGQLKGSLGKLIDRNFKYLITENFMTWHYIQPSKNKFSWGKSDAIVKWAQSHNKIVVGHALLWNEDGWMTSNQTREALLKNIETHIKTVVGRYKGKIPIWNVVNEFFADDGTLRTDYVLPRVLGVEGIAKAFQWAHEADPDAELWLNEYHMYLPEKATSVTEFVRQLRNLNVRIDGIGIQGHQYHVDNSTGGSARAPTINDFKEALLKCSAVGVKCWITELDVTVLPNKWKCCKGTLLSDYPPAVQREYDPYVDGVPSDVELLFTNRYRDFFAMTLQLPSNVIQSVQFWGITDKYSWYNSRPIKGRTDYPLLWDRQEQPKTALGAVLALRGYTSA